MPHACSAFSFGYVYATPAVSALVAWYLWLPPSRPGCDLHPYRGGAHSRRPRVRAPEGRGPKAKLQTAAPAAAVAPLLSPPPRPVGGCTRSTQYLRMDVCRSATSLARSTRTCSTGTGQPRAARRGAETVAICAPAARVLLSYSNIRHKAYSLR